MSIRHIFGAIPLIFMTACGANATSNVRPTSADVSSSVLDAKKLLEPGPEAARLAKQVGSWDVVMTMKPAPDAQPVVVKGIVAQRTMEGLYLHEEMLPAPGSQMPAFKRTDYLTFDPVQTRWEYVSMDSRAPIGIMFAKSFERDFANGVTVYFDNFGNPGIGNDVGFMVRVRHVDVADSEDRSFKRQYWTKPGTPEWMAIEYAYTRHRG